MQKTINRRIAAVDCFRSGLYWKDICGTEIGDYKMLNVGKIEEGFVMDHIKAGKSMEIYRYLQLDKLDCTVAIIKNARSNKMGK